MKKSHNLHEEYETQKSSKAQDKLEHSMGLDQTFETSMAAAFKKATKAKARKATE